MLSLQNSQLNGTVENDTDGSVDPNYKFPAHEKHLVHAKIFIPEFDVNTGQPKHKEKVQMYSPKVFKTQMENNGFAGYKVEILHDPTKDGSVTDGITPQTAGGQSLGDRHHPDTVARLKAGESITPEEKIAIDAEADKANKTELLAKYKELYGEDADAAWTKADLQVKIKEKTEFLVQQSTEEAAAKVKATDGKGPDSNVVDINKDKKDEVK